MYILVLALCVLYLSCHLTLFTNVDDLVVFRGVHLFCSQMLAPSVLHLVVLNVVYNTFTD